MMGWLFHRVIKMDRGLRDYLDKLGAIPVDEKFLESFYLEMDKVIPEIVKAIHDRQEASIKARYEFIR